MEQGGAFVLEGVFFEDVLAQAATAPDDTEALEALNEYARAAMESGEIESVMAMAAVIGATACTHPHLDDLATELGNFVFPKKPDEKGKKAKEKKRKKRKKNSKKPQPALTLFGANVAK